MCPIFVGSEVVRSNLYRKNIGAEFTLEFGVYRDPPQTWTLVSAEAHQIIEPWAEAGRRALIICWQVGFWKGRVGFRMLFGLEGSKLMRTISSLQIYNFVI